LLGLDERCGQLFDHVVGVGDQLGSLLDQLIGGKLTGCVTLPGTPKTSLPNSIAKTRADKREPRREKCLAPSRAILRGE
jgi:hypothetical protein